MSRCHLARIATGLFPDEQDPGPICEDDVFVNIGFHAPQYTVYHLEKFIQEYIFHIFAGCCREDQGALGTWVSSAINFRKIVSTTIQTICRYLAVVLTARAQGFKYHSLKDSKRKRF